MKATDVYSKAELLKRMGRYTRDEDKLLPVHLFARACGVTPTHFKKVFKYGMYPLSDELQASASRLLMDWESGRIRVMGNASGKMWIEYREEPKPRLIAVQQLVLTPTGIRLKIGKINKSDYSDKEGLFHAVT